MPDETTAAQRRDDALRRVDEAARRGDLLQAFDRASESLADFPDDEALKHRGLLALARAGATARAERLFREWGLSASDNVDVLALGARLAKDRGLKLAGTERRAGLRMSADLYRSLYERKPLAYLGINWASVAFLAGDRDEARQVAQTLLASDELIGGADYWSLATRAEAKLLTGEVEGARADLESAAADAGAAAGRATTRRQLRLVMREAGFGASEIEAVLSPLAAPPSLHGFDIAGMGEGFPAFAEAAAESAARGRIRDALAALRPAALHASLATPAEILLAEEAVAAGIELIVVLPVPADTLRQSVLAPAGAGWADRFDACLGAAARVEAATEDSAADTGTADYAARIAMGLTLLRAEHLDGEAVQLVLDSGAGTAASETSVAWLADAARRQVRVALNDAAPAHPSTTAGERRLSCAVVFGDLPGFSSLPETMLPIFWETVMAAIGDVLGESGEAVALKNTWGDAIHIVIPDVRRAAEICLAVQKRLATIDGSVLGRTEAPTMRIGAHFGPVFEGWDPVVAQRTFYGRALSRAARIEPITPPGTVYVTEAFAAILLLESRGAFTCTYVGQVPLAKGYGTFRMYDLAAG